jgi:2-polyprenyl-3-methyl-5-hydroxy-6-metoxy-1,4-benzoquinol methylase
MTKDQQYVGIELDLFAQVSNWNAYIKNEIGSYIKGHVLEVGAGIGGITRILFAGREKSWTCLEPNKDLYQRLTKSIQQLFFNENKFPKAIRGNIDNPALNRKFDTILYINVLEHIEKDELEIKKAAQKLNQKGCLIVLAPAHQYLYSPFDEKIGHFRRYHRKRLVAIRPMDTNLLRVRYLDSVGCLASLGNKIILRVGIPTRDQIMMWDRLMVPLSRIFDFVFNYKIGKSIYIVWQRT